MEVEGMKSMMYLLLSVITLLTVLGQIDPFLPNDRWFVPRLDRVKKSRGCKPGSGSTR